MPRGVEYVATDILADPKIGIGRGAFYEARVGPFARVQADGEHLPFADGAFDLVYCVAALHHALDLCRMVSELARVTRRGGVVAALNEGTRAVRASGEVEDQAEEKELRDQRARAHALRLPLGVRARGPRRHAASSTPRATTTSTQRRIGGKLRRLPLVGRSGGDLVRADLLRLLGREPLRRRKLVRELSSVNVMTRGPGDRVAAMLGALPAGRRRDPGRASTIAPARSSRPRSRRSPIG